MSENRYTRAELLEEIERLAEEGEPPSMTEMREVGRISPSTYRHRFGSWSAAVEAAGFTPLGASDGSRKADRELTEEEILDAIRRLAEELGRPPRKSDVREHGEISYYPIHSRFGGLEAALEEAGIEQPPSHYVSTGELIEELRRLDEIVDGPPTVDDIRERAEYAVNTYTRRFGSIPAARRAAGVERGRVYDIPEAELLEDLQRLHEEVGRVPTAKDVAQHGAFGTDTYVRRFGGLANAQEAAGLEPRYLDVEEADLVASLQQVATAVSGIPTAENIREHSEHAVKTFQRHFGSLADAREAAGLPRGRELGQGQFRYGPGWDKRKRAAVRARDDYVCQDGSCSMTNEAHLQEFGEQLHVHHIVRARSISDPERRNAIENLITLCRECHYEWEEAEGYAPSGNELPGGCNPATPDDQYDG